MFTVEERLELIREAAAPIMKKARLRARGREFSGLAIEAARKAGATLILRGLRDSTDFDYEMQMAGMNGAMAPELRTVFLPASSPVRPITATLVRQIASMGGDASPFAPAERDRGAEGEIREGSPEDTRAPSSVALSRATFSPREKGPAGQRGVSLLPGEGGPKGRIRVLPLPLPPLLAQPRPVVEPFAQLALEAAFDRLVERVAAELRRASSSGR